jgi:hydroxymethylglutaryl-CoA lyase
MSAAGVEIVEVGPRDGLQNEAAILDTAVKAELVRRLAAAGVRRVEAVSFASPRRVPQMADAEGLLAQLPPDPELTCVGLVLNDKGFARARAAGVREVNYVLVASESFSRRNQGLSVEESLATFARIAGAARAAGVRCSATLTAAFGCPFEGEVPLERVVELADRALAAGAGELVLADTIGVAAPPEVVERIEAVRARAGGVPLRCHFHNTRNTGIANVYAAYQAGVRRFDASCGGIGGCPFAPRATGNVPTEDVAYLFERMGVSTGLSIPRLIETSLWLERQLGHPVASLVTRAGPFPPQAG